MILEVLKHFNSNIQKKSVPQYRDTLFELY